MDVCALQSQLRLRGLDSAEHLVRVKRRDRLTIVEDNVLAAMTDEVALVLLPIVLYRSGQLLGTEKLPAAAHEWGIVIGFDAAYSIDAVPHRFWEWGVGFALWRGTQAPQWRSSRGSTSCSLYPSRSTARTAARYAPCFGCRMRNEVPGRLPTRPWRCTIGA